VALHRRLGTWINQVDAFIAFTSFQRDLLIKAGLPADLVHVKPNFYPGKPTVLPWKERRKSVVFAGRLTSEKGVESLLRAWMMWGSAAPELRIVGDGPLRTELEHQVASETQVKVRFLGQLSATATQAEIAEAQLLVLPSKCFEGFPMVLREAFAFGTPTAVSDIGPLPSIVKDGVNGLVFSPATPQSILDVVRRAWESKDELNRLATGARNSFEDLYTEAVNYNLLMEIYQKAIGVSRKRKS
jgi:glycosyltransferase involved in cell wall biosynthesis